MNKRKEKERMEVEQGPTEAGGGRKKPEPIPPVKTIGLNYTKTRMKGRRLSDLWPKDLEDRECYNDYGVQIVDVQHLPPEELDKWAEKYEVAKLFRLFTPEGARSARFCLNDLKHLKEIRDVFRELTDTESDTNIFKTLADALDDETRREETMNNPITELFREDRERDLEKNTAEVTARVKAETASEYEAKSKDEKRKMLKSFALTLAADGQPVQKISLYTKLSEDEVRMILAEQSPEYHI